jgi:hypothetical protein
MTQKQYMIVLTAVFMVRAVFDLETVSSMVPNDKLIEFRDPHYFELQSAGSAIEEDSEVMDRKHLTCNGWGEENELTLIEDINDSLEAVSPEHKYRINRHPDPDR